MINRGLEDVAIVGAGIGGLATAIALSQRGATVQVFEQANAVQNSGAGIWMPPNAMQVFACLGVANDIKRSGIEISCAELHDYLAGLLQTINTKSFIGWCNVAIQRRILQQILVNCAARTTTILFDHRLSGLREEQKGVSLQFSNSASHRAGIVVGADGIHSEVRRALFPDSELRYSGQTSWRAVIPFALPLKAIHKSIEIWAPGARFGYSAVAEDQVYWYATADAPPDLRESSEQARQRLMKMAEPFPWPIGDLVSGTVPEALIRTDLWDLPASKVWHRGRSVLLGDAAHAATPNLGQGGAQAVEDAWALAQVLAEKSDAEEAFRQFEQVRARRVALVARKARQLGRLAHLGGFGRFIRNIAFWATPAAIVQAQTNQLYDPGINKP
ncbi:FAD-dependent oxidoreductase [Edaphobacter aggregans]|uniref:FAD-dependent oxidoreductase n=1 Tax=Edaphobacter aggregans TaxID=570835 RepID=UPI000552B379|nr:FAD-dependent oxidoreductase [Edaphobacter aggregans]